MATLDPFQPPPSSSSASSPFPSPLTPLRRPRSPPSPTRLSEYTFRSSTRSRPLSILQSSSFNMGVFSFRDKNKGKDAIRTSPDVVKAAESSKSAAHAPLRSATLHPPDSSSRPSTPNGLLTLNKPKYLNRKRSLASLLTAATEGSTAPQAMQPTRTKSSDAASSLSAALLPKTHRQRTGIPDFKKEDHRPIHTDSRAEPRPTTPRKTARPKRHGVKGVPTPPDTIYMQAYDPILLENDRYSTLLLCRLNPLNGPSFHDYGSKTPSTVLDLGCGSGQWLSEATNAWGQSLITGFDLVDLLPPELHDYRNVSFMQGNFLIRPWPFPKQSFELVRMANLSLCIPSDKWELVLSEVQRVLTIGGRLELIDDQILFPYAPPSSTTTPRTARPPTMSPPLIPNKRDSFLSMDDDDDTLQNDEDDSSNSESTLWSDREMSPFSDSTPDHLSAFDDDGSDPPTPLLRYDPGTPSSTSTNTITLTYPEKSDNVRPTSWSLDAAASRDLETIFEGMLSQKFGIHTRPSDFLPDMIQKVFGNGEKIGSYHLKLAPEDALDVSSSDVGSEKEEKASLKVTQMITEITKEWEEKKRIRKANKIQSPVLDTPGADTQGAVFDICPPVPDGNRTPVPDARIPDGVSAKAAGRLGITEEAQLLSRVPDQVSVKAASRLGITSAPLEPCSEDGPVEASLDESPTLPPTIPIITEETVEDLVLQDSTSQRLSWKAANRLGISYSALTAATAASRRPLSSSSTLVPSAPSTAAPCQSPGLIVLPSKFIQLSPSELEMHACKYIHTLLGCRPALSAYVETFLDVDGSPLQTADDFDQAIWDYECFRRRRLNWPPDIPNWDVDIDDPPDFTHLSKPGSAPSKPSQPRLSSETTSSVPDVLDVPPYVLDTLTHVRTLRVYGAVKAGEHSSTPSISS